MQKVQQNREGCQNAQMMCSRAAPRCRAREQAHIEHFQSPKLSTDTFKLSAIVTNLFADFSLSGGCFPICLIICYKKYQTLYDV